MACGRDPESNLRRAQHLIEHAAAEGAKIICTQELFRTQYFCQAEDHANFALAEPVPGPTTQALSEQCSKLGVVIIGSVFERRAPGLYHNTAVVIDADGTLLGIYRKMHIPDDPLYYEKFYFTPGDLGFRTWQTQFARIAALVCWDQWFPEAARIAALQGAEIIFYPTAIGWHPAEKRRFGRMQYEAWETVQRAHAIANGCYVVAVNRVGHEQPYGPPGIQFWGGSFVADPMGRVIARAGTTRDEVLVVELDLAAVDQTRVHWPFLRDRRIDAYGNILQRLAV